MSKPTARDIFIYIIVSPAIIVMLPVILVVEVFKTIFGIKGWTDYGAKMAEGVTWLWLMFLGTIVAAPFIYLLAVGIAGYAVLWMTGGIAIVLIFVFASIFFL